MKELTLHVRRLNRGRRKAGGNKAHVNKKI
jgi:hypothetical protein